jgi:hypothetical protein
MKRISVTRIALSAALMAALLPTSGAQSRGGIDPLTGEPDRYSAKMPSGKSQRDEIIKADHKKNLEDMAELTRLTAEVRDELEKSDANIVSVKLLKKLDDIEKLTRNIRGRLKRL